jgi:hypothetical protein
MENPPAEFAAGVDGEGLGGGAVFREGTGVLAGVTGSSSRASAAGGRSTTTGGGEAAADAAGPGRSQSMINRKGL